jgi:hypothetical protein
MKNQRQAQNSKIEHKFEDWYDNRNSSMPPAALESFLAGYNEAKKELKNGKTI